MPRPLTLEKPKSIKNMRKLILFVATSLDNYIAKKDGGVDWLFTDNDYGFTEFFNGVGTTLMGYKTYQKVLSFGDFPYKEKKNYVFTRDKQDKKGDYVDFVSEDIPSFVENLKKQEGKPIWLIGGGEIASFLLNKQLVDELVLAVHPIILGEGIPLFKNIENPLKLKLLGAKSYPSGLVNLKYQQP